MDERGRFDAGDYREPPAAATTALDIDQVHHGAEQRPELERQRWMIEEYRVSLFAQDLRTAIPVSDKRLTEQVAKARAEASRR